MKAIILSAISVTLVLTFVGCGQTSEEIKTVEYYKLHVSERKTKIDECLNNPGELKNTPNCTNATRAQIDGGIAVDPSKAPDGKKYQKF